MNTFLFYIFSPFYVTHIIGNNAGGEVSGGLRQGWGICIVKNAPPGGGESAGAGMKDRP
jgi:hypothetical protein